MICLLFWNVAFGLPTNKYREASIIWTAARSHVIPAQCASCDFSQWRRHMIAAWCASCDCSFRADHSEFSLVKYFWTQVVLTRHLIAAWRASCDCSQWRRHMIPAWCASCDCSFGAGDWTKKGVKNHIGHMIYAAYDLCLPVLVTKIKYPKICQNTHQTNSQCSHINQMLQNNKNKHERAQIRGRVHTVSYTHLTLPTILRV